jgi:hypothetical protein
MRTALHLLPLLLAAFIFFAAHHIAQPPVTLRPKIFVIGLSKTGTSSIGDALALLGYKRLGWKDIRSRHLVHTWYNGDLDALIDQTRYYDAFEDLPWPVMYRELAALYPDAKFVLSLRKDEGTWLRSMRRHVSRGRWEAYQYFYGSTEVDGNEETVLQSYRNHTDNVRAFFRHQPERYTELVIDDGDKNWDVLCRVADCTQRPGISFPRSNTAAHWQNGALADNLHYFWLWSITRVEELSARSYYRGGWISINALLAAIWTVVSTIEQACSEVYFRMTVPTLDPTGSVDFRMRGWQHAF